VAPGALAAEAERLRGDGATGRRGDGATVFFVATDGHPAGLVAVAYPVKDMTPATIAELTAEGIRVVMLTGDNRTTATAVARRHGHGAVFGQCGRQRVAAASRAHWIALEQAKRPTTHTTAARSVSARLPKVTTIVIVGCGLCLTR